MHPFEVRRYITAGGREVVTNWCGTLKDHKARIAIERRIYRLEAGNFGDHRSCREGVWELRVDTGPGYRLYYALREQTIVLLLCGGDKRSQDADIARACEYWQDWQRRSAQEKDR
jgi:putative addiction module killer protein